MKNFAISAAIIATAAFSMNSASAADGRITLNGSIDSVTCSVRGGAGSDGNAANFTVTMKGVSESALATPGVMVGETPFSVIVGGSGEAGCTNGKVANLTFEPISSEYDALTKRLRNSGTATGVVVGITDNAGVLIDLTDRQKFTSATISGNTAILNFKAHYYPHPLEYVKAGTVKATMQYSLSYN